MSRYVKMFEVENSELLKNRVEAFLQENRFVLGQRKNEDTWMRRGVNCRHCVIINYEADKIELTAFIVYNKYELNQTATFWVESEDETESTIKGLLGGFGKWPIQKTIRQLEKMFK